MKVWIVVYEEMESSEISGVFDSEEQARDYVRIRGGFAKYNIEEWEVK